MTCANVSTTNNDNGELQCGALRRDDIPMNGGNLNMEFNTFATSGKISWSLVGGNVGNNYGGQPGWTFRWWVRY
jgi:hypothetical protein